MVKQHKDLLKATEAMLHSRKAKMADGAANGARHAERQWTCFLDVHSKITPKFVGLNDNTCAIAADVGKACSRFVAESGCHSAACQFVLWHDLAFCLTWPAAKCLAQINNCCHKHQGRMMMAMNLVVTWAFRIFVKACDSQRQCMHRIYTTKVVRA